VALSISQTVALSNVLKPKMKVCSFGYPDIIAPMDMLVNNFYMGESTVNYRADSEAICKRHGINPRPIPDAESFFETLGCKLHVYDIVRERGCEILQDLNRPMVKAAVYDVVLDVGTLEHCFNIAQAMMNMAGMVKVGGYIIHENPFLMGNHGFYGLNPTFYADFYKANGFELLECKLATIDGRSASVSHTHRFKYEGAECNVFAMARRVAIASFVFPVQSKYANVIPAAGVPSGEKETQNV